MPTQKYRVDTDKGSYEVEVDAPVAQDPPGTLRGTTMSEMVDNTTRDAIRGFAKGVVPGAVGAVKDAIPSIISGVAGMLKGTGNLLSDPVKTLSDAYEAVKGTPGKASEMLSQALDLAKKDPEAFGRQVGELTGATEVGVVGSKALPLAPKPVARVVGNTMESIGRQGKWPIRMMGAHQLGSGNPMGIATMMLPEGLQKSGAAIRAYGGQTVAPDVASKLESQFGDAMAKKNTTFADQQAAGIKSGAIRPPNGTRNVDLAPTPGKPPIQAQSATAPATERVPYGASPVAPSKAAAAEEENATRLATVNAAKEGLEKGAPVVRESTSATAPGGTRVSASSTYKTPEPSVEDQLAALKAKGAKMAPASTPVGPSLDERMARTKTAGGKSATLADADTSTDELEALIDGIHGPDAPTVGNGALPSTGRPMLDELMNRPASTPSPSVEDLAAAPKPQKIPVPPTKSSRPMMSATPGLTVEDMKGLGLDPKIKLKAVTPDIIEKVKANRLAREKMHRTNAGLDKGGTDAVNRDK